MLSRDPHQPNFQALRERYSQHGPGIQLRKPQLGTMLWKLIAGSATTIATFLIFSGIVGGFCWTYILNTLLIHFGRIGNVTFLQGFLIGLVPGLGQMSLPMAVITWILTKFW